MATIASDVVNATFTKATDLATATKGQADSFISSLASTIYQPPTIAVTWNSLAAPSLPSMPSAPSMPTIAFTVPGGAPGELSLATPTISIDDFSELAPSLALPDAPAVSYGTAPTVPSIADVTIPSAPTISTPSAPTMMSIASVSFAGVDLHADRLAKLDEIPTLDLVAPTPYSYARGAEYASALLDNLKGKIDARLQGGTGLSPAVEQAIWDRARDRETAIANANILEVQRQSDALGFQLPAGVISAQMRQAEQEYYDKLSELSRDISVKQAELEQQNLKDAITSGMQLEGQLIDYSFKLEQLSFETAKQYADNAIQVYNAQVEGFKALLSGYQTYAQAYDTIIKAELAKVEAYKAQLDGERTKAEVNTALVNQYKAMIEAGMAQVEIYKAQVGGAQALIQLEQAKIGAAGEQIRAYVAQVNAETAKVEAYKAAVQGEATKVEVYKTKAQAFGAKTQAQAEKARAEIARYSAMYQAKASEWEGYKVKVATEGERIRALGMQSSSLLDGYKASATAITAQAEMNTKVWETQIKQYEAGQNITLQTAKINGDHLIQTNNARLDAAKVAAQTYAQLTSSAYSMIHASAGVSGSVSNGVNFSYSNDTTGTVPSTTMFTV